MISEFVASYGNTILYAMLTAMAGYAVKLLKGWAEAHTKKEGAEISVKSVEQVYGELPGEEKLIKATESLKEMLSIKGITISDLEARTRIEAAVNENQPMWKHKKEENRNGNV